MKQDHNFGDYGVVQRKCIESVFGLNKVLLASSQEIAQMNFNMLNEFMAYGKVTLEDFVKANEFKDPAANFQSENIKELIENLTTHHTQFSKNLHRERQKLTGIMNKCMTESRDELEHLFKFMGTAVPNELSSLSPDLRSFFEKAMQGYSQVYETATHSNGAILKSPKGLPASSRGT
jgi:hypothetical protein